MKKTLFRNNLILFSCVLFVLYIGAIITLYTLENKNQDKLMNFIFDEVLISYENFNGEPLDFITIYQNDNERRITILDENKIVLADSSFMNIGESKENRPELNNLNKVYKRKSVTLDTEMLYLAKRLDNGYYLRVAIPLKSRVSIYNNLVIVLVITTIITVFLYSFFLNKIQGRLIRSLKQVKSGVTALNNGSYQTIIPSPYQEINEITKELDQLNYELFSKVLEINQYKEELTTIINDLGQAVLLINLDNEIVFSNEDAKEIFKINEEKININYAIRDVSLKDAIKKANNNRVGVNFDITYNQKVYYTKIIVLNEIKSANKASLMVLLNNVTKERNIQKVKRDFFSYASHELKSPITVIKGYAELLQLELISKEEFKDIVNEINKQADTLSIIIDDMLTLSRLENNDNEILEKVDAKTVLLEVIDLLKPLIKEKEMKVNLNIKTVFIHCVLLDLHKLFKNLIENAIIYSKPKKELYIELESENNNLLFSVKDQGIGIDIEHQERIFERFYRVNKDNDTKGTGLGLAIVKHIVIKYKGTIKLTSKINEGSIFCVRLRKNSKAFS